MKFSHYIVCLAAFSPATFANELPPILDFYPLCSPQTINTANDKMVYDIDPDLLKSSNGDVLSHRDAYVQQALVEIQRKASAAGADAVIVDRLTVGGIDRSIDLQDGSNRAQSSTQQIHVITTVQYVNLCDDTQLSSDPTPYNSKGKAVSYTQTTVKLTMPNEGNLLKQAQKHQAPDALITTDSAYGIHIGDSVDDLLPALGPHSIQLQLDNGATVYGYGRSLWFVIKDSRVAMITQDLGLLNGHGQNQIPLSENYDSDNWVIANKVHQGDELNSVKAHLALKKQGDVYSVAGKNSRLLLTFEDYNESMSQEAVSRLNSFAILPLTTIDEHQVNFGNFDNIDIATLLTLTSPQAYTLQPQQLSNQIQLTESGAKVLVNSNVLLGFDRQGVVNSINITESMFGAQTMSEFKAVLARYNLPAIKSELLARYPIAEDNFDNIMLTEGGVMLSINFDSYDDDAQLIDLTLHF
ncbi:hypothetical protein GCM10009347_00020 [Shewanella algicola]|uniref:Uncharacterized protein n=1 Tax=Shewanella algicola TaxID=640633 RepID=A0A9X1Z2R1_9GAMM|nr:hypothetical protein [Shewanella algicola]MCL1103893.1 hypothetical protein [Shewanella algicola]GGP36302.1 hypothetical protein GCM10009347_00020 [Shewanella algicola]